MKLGQLINQYINYRRSLGEKFNTNATYLKAFCETIGDSVLIESITEEIINKFLYQTPVTSGWFIKYGALLGFYRYIFSRGYITKIPLPNNLPKRPPQFVPYVYSQNELQLLFNTALKYSKYKTFHSPYTVRAILIFTYALGLRIHETLSINLQDINMDDAIITIGESKFYKSRIITFNQEVKLLLEKYLQWRKQHTQPQLPHSPLFIGRNNLAFNIDTLRNIFQHIRELAGIKMENNARYQPRIHDLRHTFAVNVLTSWYQDNKDVQQLLPMLSVYLGHKHITNTTVYLTMIDNLLREANVRFEEYAIREEL